MVQTAVNNGLEGIVVAETEVSHVDGEHGKLIIKGHDAEELAFSATFEGTCALLWSVSLPTENAGAREVIQKRFAQYRQEAFELLKENASLLIQNHPMDALRTATSFLTSSTESDIAAFARISAAIGVFAANWSRLHEGLPLAEPDSKFTQAADILRMIRNEIPSQAEIEALDTYLTAVSDHGMNASTFTARVVASTLSDNISCIVAAIGALKGPLHGGAPGPVLEMLDAIKTPENAEPWLRNELDCGRRIMGMGHRIYKVRDPRAAIFERAIKKLEDSGVPAKRLKLARAVEKKAEELLAQRHPERPLKANVEFYTAVLLDTIQIPAGLFSAMFATGRVGGWCAHIAEQRAHGRLIRPASIYIGPSPN